jgi:hypothetical protein
MTDTQTITTAILGAAGVIATAVKWAARQLARTQDRGTMALVKSAESNAMLAAKFDALTSRFETLTARFDHFVEILLANGIGLATVARLGRAPTAPTLTAIPALPEDHPEDHDDD